MPAKAAKRRQARNERKAASRPQRRPEGRSALEHRLNVGMYAAFVMTGILIVAGAFFWSVSSGGSSVVHAEVAGVSGTVSQGRTANRDAAPAALPPQAELPVLEGSATMASGQPLLPAIDPLPVAPTSNPTEIKAASIITGVNITFYDCANQGFCGAMYNGRKVYEGAAACSWNMPIGTRFVVVGDPTHRIYICEDRGLLANTWVDIFWYHPADGYKWQSHVGRYGTIEIVSMP